MNSEDDPERADRLKFVVAIMTKDYSKAIDMGTLILNREPNDRHVRNCLSALRKIQKTDKTAEMRDLSDQEESISTASTEESDEAGSSIDGSDDETCDRVIDVAAAANSNAEMVCNSRSSRSIADCVRESVSASTGSTDGKLFTFCEKMYRVLPLKFLRKK